MPKDGCASVPSMQRKAVLALLVDGARADVLARMAEAGELPTLKKVFIDRGGMATATSVFPTVSGPAHLPLLTGIHPGTANLPGIRWAERPTGGRGRFLGRTRSYMAPLRAWKLERDVPASVSTLFSHVPSMADVNTWFVRGCPSAARRTRWSKPTAFVRALLTRDWHSSEDQAEKALVRALDQGFTSVHAVFPAIDELGHRFGPLSEPSFEAYRRFDRALQRILDALVRRGQAEETLIVISSDHGQTATHTHVDIDDVVRDDLPQDGLLSEALAFLSFRTGGRDGFRQFDGESLRSGIRRLAGATGFRCTGVAGGNAQVSSNRASGH